LAKSTAKAAAVASAHRALPPAHVCPLSQKLIRWMRLFRGQTQGMTFAEAAQFIHEHPRWPGLSLLVRHAEDLVAPSTPHKEVVAWFEKHPPKTGGGCLRFMDALAATAASNIGAEARKMWTTVAMSQAETRTFYHRYRHLLTAQDHWDRLDHLLWIEKEKAAEWMLPLVDSPHRHLAKARLSLMTMAKDAQSRLDQVPMQLRHDEGLVFERTRWRRKRDMPKADEPLLQHTVKLSHPKRWIRERMLLVRRAIEARRYQDAYKLAAEHGLDRGSDFADAEWLAGWLSLRYTHHVDRAIKHFQHLANHVATPLSKGRAAYWLGEAFAKAGRQQDAQAAWTEASKNSGYFYGQLACLKLASNPFPSAMPKPIFNQSEQKQFAHREEALIVQLLARTQHKKALEVFVEHFASILASPHERQLFVTLVSQEKPGAAVRAARKASSLESVTIPVAYPLEPELLAQAKKNSLDPALVLAVVRQESDFDPEAVSSAGARGLMQLMLATAKEWAKKLKMAFAPHKLATKPFNLALGCAHLNKLLESFEGNYVVTLAAYNGGAGNVGKWLKIYGDPRRADVDPVDWIELIPFAETRTYVHRVLENVAWYKLRLAAAGQAGGASVKALAEPPLACLKKATGK
jgi:soluble lytic murein transglycosylase